LIESGRPIEGPRYRERKGASAESCSLDVADRGGATLDQVGEALGVSRERTRRIEESALAKLAAQLGGDFGTWELALRPAETDDVSPELAPACPLEDFDRLVDLHDWQDPPEALERLGRPGRRRRAA
jgi:hypothetical protein